MSRRTEALLDTLVNAYRYALRNGKSDLAIQALSACRDVGAFRNDSKIYERVNKTIDIFRKCGIIKMDGEDDPDGGHWVTTEENHKIHINEEGVPDKGNPYVLAVMKGGTHRKSQDVSKELGEVTGNIRKLLINNLGKVSTYRGIQMRKEDNRKESERARKKYENAKGIVDKFQEENPDVKEFMKYSVAKIKKLGLEAFQERNELQKQLEIGSPDDAERERLIEEIDRLTKVGSGYAKAEAAKKMLSACKREVTAAEKHEKEFAEYAEQKEAETKEIVDEWQKLHDQRVSLIRERDEAVKQELPNIEACKTADDVVNYLAAHRLVGNYDPDDPESKFRLAQDDPRDFVKELGGMDVKMAVGFGKQLESMCESYPKLRGMVSKIELDNKHPNAYAYVDPDTLALVFTEKNYSTEYFVQRTLKAWERDCSVDKFHPPNLKGSHFSIVTHELTHIMEAYMNEHNSDGRKAADIVMERVSKRMYGVSAGHEDEIRKQVSNYAADNKGTRGNNSYGENTEFLAEAIAEAINGDNPREVARFVKEEFDGLMKERGLL